jgi:hypothetical protein
VCCVVEAKSFKYKVSAVFKGNDFHNSRRFFLNLSVSKFI